MYSLPGAVDDLGGLVNIFNTLNQDDMKGDPLEEGIPEVIG